MYDLRVIIVAVTGHLADEQTSALSTRRQLNPLMHTVAKMVT